MFVRICTAAFVALALVACSGTSTGTGDLFGDGGASNPNGTNGGGDGSKSVFGGGTKTGGTTPGAGGTATSNGTTTATCTLKNAPLGTGACDQCVGASCCSQAKACDGSDECIALVSCANGCNDDKTCVQDCVDQHQAGLPPLQTLSTCMQQSCSAKCQ